MSACGACGKPGVTAKCGACRAVVYCNQACQKAAWEVHKPMCVPVAKPAASKKPAESKAATATAATAAATSTASAAASASTSSSSTEGDIGYLPERLYDFVFASSCAVGADVPVMSAEQSAAVHSGMIQPGDIATAFTKAGDMIQSFRHAPGLVGLVPDASSNKSILWTPRYLVPHSRTMIDFMRRFERQIRADHTSWILVQVLGENKSVSCQVMSLGDLKTVDQVAATPAFHAYVKTAPRPTTIPLFIQYKDESVGVLLSPPWVSFMTAMTLMMLSRKHMATTSSSAATESASASATTTRAGAGAGGSSASSRSLSGGAGEDKAS